MVSRLPTVLGVDEAGRGPILGPLCLAAVVLDPGAARSLKRLGVRDSKTFGAGPQARRERAYLARAVRQRARLVVERVVPPEVIDARCQNGELNHLERELGAEMVAEVQAQRRARGEEAGQLRIVFDGRLVFGELADRLDNAIAVDGADDGWVAVAAASLVAKRRRDALFGLCARQIRRELGLRPGEPLTPAAAEPTVAHLDAGLPHDGGGYINEATRRLFEAYVQRHRRLPPHTRRSWRWAFLEDLCRRYQLDGALIAKAARPAKAAPQVALIE